MTPSMRVALSAGGGALGGALVGGLLGLAGAAVLGARRQTRGRELAVILGVGVGAAAGSAALGGYVEHKELASGSGA